MTSAWPRCRGRGNARRRAGRLTRRVGLGSLSFIQLDGARVSAHIRTRVHVRTLLARRPGLSLQLLKRARPRPGRARFGRYFLALDLNMVTGLRHSSQGVAPALDAGNVTELVAQDRVHDVGVEAGGQRVEVAGEELDQAGGDGLLDDAQRRLKGISPRNSGTASGRQSRGTRSPQVRRSADSSSTCRIAAVVGRA